MKKYNYKNIFVWILIILISISLVMSNLFINAEKSKSEFINISNYKIKNIEINNLAEKLLQNKKNIKSISNIKKNIEDIIKTHINFNFKIIKMGSCVTEKNILFSVLTEEKFKINNIFSKNLYENYLKNFKVTNKHFQEYVKKIILQKKLKEFFNLTKKNIKINFKKFSIKNNIKNFNFRNNKNFKNNCRKILIYIDLSVPIISQKIKINKKNLNKFYTDKKYIYTKKKLYKITYNNKKVWISNNELNKNLQEKLKNLNCDNIKLLKNKESKIYDLKNVLDDVKNKYKKQKSYNYKKKYKSKIKNNKDTDRILKRYKLKTKFIDKERKNDLMIKNNNNLIKKESTILLEYKKYNSQKINNYFNKLIKEKKILNIFLKIKKNIYKKSFNNINNPPLKIIRNIEINSKKSILKYKTNYYIINNHTIKKVENSYKKLKKSLF